MRLYLCMSDSIDEPIVYASVLYVSVSVINACSNAHTLLVEGEFEC